MHQTELASCDAQPAKAQFVISIGEETEGSTAEAPKLLIASEQQECTPAEFESMGTLQEMAVPSLRIIPITKNYTCCIYKTV